ncbi:MAG: response regulator, partial [Ewingella sp.]|nr:response regulator [Ewingella sp.]
TEYYLMFGLAGILVISTLLWAFWLRRAMKVKQKAQAALLLQLNFRDTLLNGSPTPIYVVNRHGEVISHNRAYDQFFAQVAPEHMALPLFDQRHPLSPLLPALEPLLSQQEIEQDGHEYQQRATLFNGEEHRIVAHWTTVLNDHKGAIDGLICGWQDITDYENLLVEVSAEKDNAQQANKAKSTFLATMSHEIRTPVSAIIGLLELAENSRNADTPDGEALQLAYTSAQSLIELVGDVLDLAKIESGNLELSPQWVSPVQTCSSVIHIFEGLAQQKGLKLSWDNRLTQDIEVWLDPQRLKQVLYNYLSNALKFTTRGTVGIELSGAQSSEDRLQMQVVVHDTGIGISDEDQKKLFVPFKQLDAGKKQTGTGLGLVISAELIQLMSGTCRFDSKPGQGTRVILTFDLPARAALHSPAVTEDGLRITPRSLDILIADDHPTNRLLLRRQLTSLGHRVIEAVNGEQALRLWQEHHVDLVITDCHMPVMDGLALTRAIRQNGQPAMIWGLTANAQAAERKASLDVGMNECFFKPLRMKQLNAALHQLALVISTPPPLETLLDLPSLRSLAMKDDALLKQMLEQTRDENRRDVAAASAALEKEDWRSFAEALHKISGAAQIVGAEQIEEMASMMEDQTFGNPDAEALNTDFRQLCADILQLDQAIRLWLIANDGQQS